MFESIPKLSQLWLMAQLSALLCPLLVPNVCAQQITTTANTSWSCEELDYCSDRLGFEAIQWLHRQLDDDHNGNVDITESNEFLRDELKYENGYERQKVFHGNDKQITVDELWKAWKLSTVRNWTIEETVDWLCNVVELPQYVQQFQTNAVDGLALPRLAANTQFIQILGIHNPIHKQKLALKAMDVVLFGAAKHHNYIKDVLLLFSLVIAIGGVWFAYVQHKSSQSHLKKMLKDMDSLQRAEEQLSGLQRELDRTREEQQMVFKEKVNLEKKLKENESQIERSASYTGLTDVSRICELEEELNRMREELKRAQNSSSRWAPAQALQHWLQLTHELEVRSFNAKRCSAEMQLYAAKEGCDRLRKSRGKFLGAFRVAHGSSIDDVDNRILQAKTALSEVTKDLQERLQRWRQIEMYCGFPIVHNPGLSYLEQVLYGSPVASSPGSLPALGLSRAGSETTIMDDDDSIGLSGSVANLSIGGFGLHSTYDKNSLLSINLNNSHRKHSNGTMPSNNSGVEALTDDELEEDIINESVIKPNHSFTIGHCSISDGLKSVNPNEPKIRPKMTKSFSEDHNSTQINDKTDSNHICHSESCSELQSCTTITSTQHQRSPSSDSPNTTKRSEKLSSNVSQTLKTLDESETASNDSNSVKDFEHNHKSISSEKKRTFFGLRKRKNSKHS